MSTSIEPKAMLAELVGFNTISDLSNLDLITFVESYFQSHGVATTRVPDETGMKASLFAQIGPEVAGGVILSGHTDVVPVAGQPWDSDPFTLTEREGRLYGRGTCDMKGSLACALAAVPEMLAADLKRPIQFALTYDEEVGCFAAPPLIEAMAVLPRAAAVIVGEPTEMQVVTGHKAICELHTHVRGFEVHSSLMHQGVSAVMTAAEMINWIAAQTEANRREAAGTTLGYEPPWTTLHVGEIRGGTAHNITARDCTFSCDIRSLPTESQASWIEAYMAEAARLADRIGKVRPEAGITVEIVGAVPGCRAEENGTAETIARRLTGDNGTHVVSYATEAGQFQDGGYSTVICGPGSIAQAHQPNEFIEVSQLAAGSAFISRLIADLSK
ncbi:acetylornithine deacetylase [Algicella marina]|uniref:Acetylornithine deacetylase n=1 Tax=Algicella marina TaxID=2683284 RepID=A0A6P1SX93_9RHOB|nr:acetylornithine deacetylase [Algicella marina]QHQ34155.1 acetylornithine deacetylase [Algicella marina]